MQINDFFTKTKLEKKKNTNDFFTLVWDPTMNANDMTLYAKQNNKFKILNNKEFGFYRDSAKSYRAVENTAKALHKVFNKLGFKMIIDTDLIQKEFLDIKLNLTNKTHITLRKLSWVILYVSNQSNQPYQILNQLPITKIIYQVTRNQLIV